MTNHITTKLTNPNQDQRQKCHHLTMTLHLTLKMTTAQVVKISVTNNSLSKDYLHPDHYTRQTLAYNNKNTSIDFGLVNIDMIIITTDEIIHKSRIFPEKREGANIWLWSVLKVFPPTSFFTFLLRSSCLSRLTTLFCKNKNCHQNSR